MAAGTFFNASGFRVAISAVNKGRFSFYKVAFLRKLLLNKHNIKIEYVVVYQSSIPNNGRKCVIFVNEKRELGTCTHSLAQVPRLYFKL